ncbi:MAG: glycosyltransferase family 9 protein [Phenylobacterium sp.]
MSLFQQAIDLQLAGRDEEAEALYLRATDGPPALVQANLGVIYRTTGRLEEAEAALRAAHALDSANPYIRHSLGMTLLQRGRYAEGWRHYAARFEFRPKREPPVGMPEWRGESLAGKRLLVIAEQGLGDQILFSRFVTLAGADELVLAVTRPLVGLLSALPAEVGNPQTWDGVKADCWTYFGQVPRWLELGPADALAPYLPCPPRPLSGLGLMLDGGATNGNNALRLPPPAVARAIQGLADFVDLRPEASGARDLAETAGIIAGLEAVVTVDTSVAHLAGAMGKPAWVLMPGRAIDWWANWHDDRSPWYPSARLIRQRRPGDWASVIADLAGVLGQT